jgi:hypothetical protein
MIRDASIRETTYRVAPKYRRCAVYVIVGMLLIVAVAIWIGRVVQQRGMVTVFLMCSIFALLALAMIVPLRWRIRVDGIGISRWHFLTWDRWSWSDFAGGTVLKKIPMTLVGPDRPWWRRRLRLEYLSDSDRKDVTELINRHYRLPPPPAIDDELKVRYGFRKSARFDADGIHVVVCNKPMDYQWSDLQRLHITRIDPVRRDFVSLEIVLPDREIELKIVRHQGGTSTTWQGATPTWQGATPEEVNEFLLAHAPAERVDVDIAGERPSKPIDVERQLQQARKQLREHQIVTWIFVPALVGILVWMAIDKSLVGALAMAGMCFAYGFPIYWFTRRERTKRTQDLEAMLRQFERSGSSGTDRGN